MEPLRGVRVLDLSRVVSGPLCTYYLAALGAEVIRVERPGGDVSWGPPPQIGPEGIHRGPRRPRDIGITPLRRHRGKRSVVLDLRRPGGLEALHRLVARSDVLVENFTPGTLEALGLGDEVLGRLRPGIIRCSITGYGEEGPYRDRPSMDLVVQAVSGLMAKTGFPDGPPTKVGVTVGDQVPALFAALGVVAALRGRERDGSRESAGGQDGARVLRVDVAMLDALLALIWDEPVDDYRDRGLPERFGNGDPRGVPLGTYACRDGMVALLVVGDAQWQAMAGLLGRPELAARLPTARDRLEHREEVEAAVAAWCAGRDRNEVVERLSAAGIPAGPVEPPWVGATDPHVRARGSLEALRHPDLPEPTPYLGARFPVRFGGRPPETAPAEPLGASTEAVLREVAGLDEAALRALREGGAIPAPEPEPPPAASRAAAEAGEEAAGRAGGSPGSGAPPGGPVATDPRRGARGR